MPLQRNDSFLSFSISSASRIYINLQISHCHLLRSTRVHKSECPLPNSCKFTATKVTHNRWVLLGDALWFQTALKNYRNWAKKTHRSSKIAHHRTFARANHDAVGSVITLEAPWHAGVKLGTMTQGCCSRYCHVKNSYLYAKFGMYSGMY